MGSLAGERARAGVDSAALAGALAGGAQRLARREAHARFLAAQPWGRKDDRQNLSREQLYVRGLEAVVGMRRYVRDMKLGAREAGDVYKLLDLPGGFGLHVGMYIPTLMKQGTPEQQAEFLAPAIRFEQIGTYAQTELGHGTYLRGLETTATFVPPGEHPADEVREGGFVLHSPTPTASKWWPGGLGKTATHAVVMARLITRDGVDRGPHAFIAQLREASTHRPLPGVEIGDIGPKLGYNAVDNGFLRFSEVFVPRRAMLAANARVDADGAYHPPPKKNAKAAYGTMVMVRADIIADASGVLSKAATIATRYAAQRRQGKAAIPGAPETLILDYGHVQRTLLVQIARAYAMHFTGKAMMDLYIASEKGKKQGNFDGLAELHMLTSGLKATCSWYTAEGVEECRRTCGGQGYSHLSGLPELLNSYVQNCTWEGDNKVLCLQCARYIVKQLWAARLACARGKRPALPPAVAHLADDARLGSGAAPLGATDAARDPELLLRAAAVAAAARALATLEMAATRALGRPLRADEPLPVEGPAWDASHVALIEAARAHCDLALSAEFARALRDGFVAEHGLGERTGEVLAHVCRLFVLERAEAWRGDLLETGLLTPAASAAVRSGVLEEVAALRPEAVALVDGFGLSDYALNSCLGCRGGEAYTRLVEAARRSPFNDTEEGPGWEPVLKDFLGSNRRKHEAKLRRQQRAAVSEPAAVAAHPTRSKL